MTHCNVVVVVVIAVFAFRPIDYLTNYYLSSILMLVCVSVCVCVKQNHMKTLEIVLVE